jgi:hypothetical protein
MVDELVAIVEGEGKAKKGAAPQNHPEGENSARLPNPPAAAIGRLNPGYPSSRKPQKQLAQAVIPLDEEELSKF